MKLAIMQPYFMPYIGYFQLMAAADKFVIYDDVNFIQRGWINRNRILLDGRKQLFVIPLSGASQNRLISELELMVETGWRRKFLKTIRHAYRQAPEFERVFAVLSEIVNFAENNLSRYLLNSLQQINNYLGIQTELVPTSAIYSNRSLKGQARILDICGQEQTSVYLNLSGGRDLYDKNVFRANGIALRFLEPSEVRYQQFDCPFWPNLSIIDVLMFNSLDKVKSFLNTSFG